MKYLYPYLLFICLSATAFAQLPLAIRVDQANTQLQNHIASNDFTGALPWLEKLVALQDEGYIMPSIMNYYAGQIYLKTGNQKAASTYLEKYVANENGKFFWDALTMYSQIELLKTKAVLEKYLSQNNPPEYQNAVDLYTKLEQQEKIQQEKARADSLEQARIDSLEQVKREQVEAEKIRIAEQKIRNAEANTKDREYNHTFKVIPAFSFGVGGTLADFIFAPGTSKASLTGKTGGGANGFVAAGVHFGSRKGVGLRLMGEFDYLLVSNSYNFEVDTSSYPDTLIEDVFSLGSFGIRAELGRNSRNCDETKPYFFGGYLWNPLVGGKRELTTPKFNGSLKDTTLEFDIVKSPGDSFDLEKKFVVKPLHSWFYGLGFSGASGLGLELSMRGTSNLFYDKMHANRILSQIELSSILFYTLSFTIRF